MKYNKQQVIDQRISFQPMKECQFDKLQQHFDSKLSYEKGYFFRFYPDKEFPFDKYGRNDTSYLNADELIRSAIEISFEDFDFEENKFTKQDWINGKCAIIWQHDKKEQINAFFKSCNFQNSEASGTNIYYFCEAEPGFYNCDDTTNLPIVTIDELMPQNEEKEIIIGYKAPFDLFNGRIRKGELFTEASENGLVMYNEKHRTSGIPKEIVQTWEPVYKQEYEAGTIVRILDGGYGSLGANGLIGTIINKPNEKPEFYYGDYFPESQGPFVRIAKQNIIWGLSPGYKIRLATQEEIYDLSNKTFEIACESGTFKLEASKNGIYYRPESVFLNVEDLSNLINFKHQGVLNTNQSFKDYTTNIHISHVDLGCKKKVKVEDIKTVLDYYYSL